MNERILKAKQDNVLEIVDKIERAQSIILVDYRGLSVEEVTDLRNQYRAQGVDYKVYKNTMMRRAFKECGLEDFNEHLVGPNAVAFGFDDPVQVAKISDEFAKKNNKLEIKAGVIDGKIATLDEIKVLASLPSREVLIAKMLGSLNAPIQGFSNVLNGTLKGLVVALNAIAEKKGQEA